jgi:hypothetical protein
MIYSNLLSQHSTKMGALSMPISTADTEPVYIPLQLLLQPLRYKCKTSCPSNTTTTLLASVAQANTTNNSCCDIKCPASPVANCNPDSIKVH